MALKFGPQWLRDLTDDGTGQAQSPTPSYGVKFKLADYRYGREEMLALYSDTHSPPDHLRKHQVIFSKDNQRPISMTPLSEDEQRLISQGINSHVLRGGRGGGVADRGRGRGRGRGDGGYVPRQNENGEQQFGRQQPNDGWEVVGRKPERSFSRGFDEQAPTKREFLRSSSNNWRDRKQEGEEEEASSGGSNWRPNRENTRWGSSRPNWRHANADYDETRPYKPRDPDSVPRGPRRISDSYDNEVPEWDVDDIGADPGTFDSRGIFVPTRKTSGTRENHHDSPRTSVEEQNVRKKHDNINERENRDPERPRSMNERAKAASKPVEEYRNEPSIPKASQKSQPVKKPEVSDYLANSMKGAGDSIHSGLLYSEKNTNGPQAPHGPASGMQEPLYHPQSQPSEPGHNIQEPSNDAGQRSSMPNAQNDNLLQMEKSLQNLLAGMTASAESKAEEEVDVSKAMPLTHKDANKWFYRDPQGKIQGPFSSESMAEWFRIGYFTMNLIVKRGCDDSFKELGELIKQYGRVPFVPGPPLPPLITNTSIPEEMPASVPEIQVPPLVMTLPSMVNPIMPGMMGPTMPSLHDRFMFRSMMLQQEYLKQQLMMQQLQMQTMAKLQEQESFKDYTPDQQHDIAMRMMMQTNPLLMQQMQQLQHQQVLLQQQQQQLQQSDLHTTLGNIGGAGPPESFQHPMSLPSMHNMSTAVPTPIPSATVHNNPNPVNEQEAGGPVWANSSQPTENSIWSQPSPMWNMDNVNEKSQAYKMHLENMKREREEEKLKEEERLKQELIESKQEELRKQQHDLQRQREQMRREKEEMEKERLKKLEEVRREEERIAQLEMERQKKEQMEHHMRMQEEKKRQEEEKKRRDHEVKKQEDKRRKEEEKLRKEEEKIKEQKRKEDQKRAKEAEELRRQQERQEREAAEARQREEMQHQLELQQIQEEEERMRRENAEAERQQQALKKQLELQKHQESLRKLQQAQKEQLANMQLPASSNWAKHAAHGSVGHSKSLTEIQEEEARREKERQKEQQALKQRMQEQAAVIQQQQQQIQIPKSWASQVSKGITQRGPSLLDIQHQEKENAKKAEKERGKALSHQAKYNLGGSTTKMGNAGLWGTNSTWESSGNAAPASSSSGGIWDMGVPSSVKKPQQGKNGPTASSIPGLQQQQQQQQQQTKKDAKSNKKAAAPKQKEVETVQKLFHNKKQDGFTSWVSEKLSRFSSVIDIPTFVSFIVEVDSPHDVIDYVKTYLGDTKETQDFSRQFLEKRNQCKNQMRLQKQLEEDSIWGPAPAINPHTGTASTAPSDSGQGSKTKNKKKKKVAAQKVDSSILGFTVSADPNRRNASGEFETID